MAIQSFKEYSRLGILGMNQKIHQRIVENASMGFPKLEINPPTRTQAVSIGERVGIFVSSEIIYLYGLLRIEPNNLFKSQEINFSRASDQVLLYEAFAFHGDVGVIEKMRKSYSNIFQ